MDGLRREDRGSRLLAMRGGSLALLCGSSFVTGGGGLVAQVVGHAGTTALLGIYGSAGLIAVVGSITAIVKILAERSPEIRKASALAKIAKRRSGQDGGTLLLLDRCLDKERSNTSQVLQALSALLTRGDGGTDDASRRPKPGEVGQSVVSIHTSDKDGSASSSPDLPDFRPGGIAHSLRSRTYDRAC